MSYVKSSEGQKMFNNFGSPENRNRNPALNPQRRRDAHLHVSIPFRNIHMCNLAVINLQFAQHNPHDIAQRQLQTQSQ